MCSAVEGRDGADSVCGGSSERMPDPGMAPVGSTSTPTTLGQRRPGFFETSFPAVFDQVEGR